MTELVSEADCSPQLGQPPVIDVHSQLRNASDLDLR
jgi:hypothetical protein